VDRTTDPISRPGRLEPDRREDDDPAPAPAGPASSPAQAPPPSSGSLPPTGTADPPAPAAPDAKPPAPAPAPRPSEAPDPPTAAQAPAAGWFAAHPGGEVHVAPPAPKPAASAPPVVRAPDPPPAAPAAAVPGRVATPGPDGEVEGVPPAPGAADAPPEASATAATAATAARAKAHESARAAEAEMEAAAAEAEMEAAAAEAEAAIRSAEAATGSAEMAAGSAEMAAGSAETAAAGAEAAAGSAETAAGSAETAAAGAEAAAAGAEAARRSAEAAAGSVEASVGSAEAAAGSARAADARALAAVRSADAAAGSVETAMRSAEAAAGSVEAALRSAEAAAGSARAAEVGAQAAVRSAAAAAASVETAVRSAEAAAGSAAAVRPAHTVTGLVAPAAADVPAARRRPRRRVGVGALLVAVAVVSGLAGGLVGATVTREREGTTPAASAGPDRTPSSDQVQQVAASVLPAVVRVQARTSGGRATGSGVIFTADGYVLTNAHVVDGARTIAVTLATAEPLKASLVGTDPLNDLAVLRVRRTALPVASFGRSADLAVGDAAIVVGSPFGFRGSVTSGIVSALHRVVKVPGDQVPGHELVDAIQTDAAINPGNSGGALADGSGRVVGISTAIATSGNVESSAGVGFAIPIDEALEVARALVARKPVRVPFLGWEVEDLSAESVVRYRLQGRTGALLGAVRPGSPAAKAELRKGDLVVRFGDVAVRDGDQLAVALRQAKIGEPVPIVIVRRGRELNLLAVPTTQPRG
jgi:putative serine protease PepD